MSAYPASPDPIDWGYYKAKISKPGFVDSFKKQVSLCSNSFEFVSTTQIIECHCICFIVRSYCLFIAKNIYK